MKTNIRTYLIVIAFALIIGTQIHVIITLRNTERGLNWSLNTQATELASVQRTLRQSVATLSTSTRSSWDTDFVRRYQSVAEQYGLDIGEAKAILVAFDELMNIDRHEQGIESFEHLGTIAGPFLFDELLSTSNHGEMRHIFIVNALRECLTPDVESDLVGVARDDSLPHFLRKHAVSALSVAQTPEAHEFLVGEFIRIMDMRPQHRWSYPYYPSIIRSVSVAKSAATVDGLLKLIEEEKDGKILDYILSAITALGKIGDNRATPVLKDLVKHEQWGVLTPEICLALVRIGDPEALLIAREAQKMEPWTPYKMSIFQQVEDEFQSRTNPQPPPERDK